MINTPYTYVNKFANNLGYVADYNNRVNKVYANWQLPKLEVTYYNLDIENSNIDKDRLQGGAYEMVGPLSGNRWRKVLLVPVTNIDPVNMIPTADEQGVTNKEKLTSFVFPQIYDIVPKVHDFISFYSLESAENYNMRNPPMFEVVNIEKSNDFEFGFYKVTAKVSYVRGDQLDQQLSGVYSMVDYEKQIYPIDSAISLYKLLNIGEQNKLKRFFNNLNGLYSESI